MSITREMNQMMSFYNWSFGNNEEQKIQPKLLDRGCFFNLLGFYVVGHTNYQPIEIIER